jgi:hypothetical protein
MKTKTIVSTSNNTILNISVTVLVILLILAVGRHLYYSNAHSGMGMGMGMGDATDPSMYPPRQMPMMFGGGIGIESGNGLAWPPNVLQNPYSAPLKDDRYLVGPPMFPMNVSTNPGAVDTSYRQVGILSQGGRGGGGGECKKCKMGIGKCNSANCGGGGMGGNSVNEDLLILMGRPLFTNRDTWQYYAISNQRNGVKLPVRVGGKNATNEYGVRELSGGDIIRVDGYNKNYRVDMYESDTIKYLPYM